MTIIARTQQEIPSNEQLPAHVVWIGNQIPDSYIHMIAALSRKFPDRYPTIVWASNPQMVHSRLETIGAPTQGIKVMGLYAASEGNPRLSNVDFLIDAAANRIGEKLSDFVLTNLQSVSQRQSFIDHVNNVCRAETEQFGNPRREVHSLEEALETYRRLFIASFKHTYSYYIDIGKNPALKPKALMAGAADALRLLILDQYKGTYLDIDCVLLNEPNSMTSRDLGELFTIGYMHFNPATAYDNHHLSQQQFYDGLNAILACIHNTSDIRETLCQQAPDMTSIFEGRMPLDVRALTYPQRNTLSGIIPKLPESATRALVQAFIFEGDQRRFEQTPAGELLMINSHASDFYTSSRKDGPKRNEPLLYNNNYINVPDGYARFTASVLLEGYRRLHEITPEIFAFRPSEALLEQLRTDAGPLGATEYLEGSDFLGLHLFTEGNARYGFVSFVGPGLLRQQVANELYGVKRFEPLYMVEPDVSIGRLLPEQKSNILFARTIGNTGHYDIKVALEKDGCIITGATIHRHSHPDRVLDLTSQKHHRITYSDGVDLVFAAEQHGSKAERLELRQVISPEQQIFQLLSDGRNPRQFQSHANTFEHELRGDAIASSPHLIELGLFECSRSGALSWVLEETESASQQSADCKNTGHTDQQIHQMINQRLIDQKLSAQEQCVHPLETTTDADEAAKAVSDKRLSEISIMVQQNFCIVRDWWKKQRLIAALSAEHGDVLVDKSNDNRWILTWNEGCIALPAFLPDHSDDYLGLRLNGHKPSRSILKAENGTGQPLNLCPG